MTLKFSRNAKVTRAITSRRPVRPAADDLEEDRLPNIAFILSNVIRTS